jgi:hypothetical protein
MDPAVILNHRAIRDTIRCQGSDCRTMVRFVAVPVSIDGVLHASLRAVDSCGGVRRGEPLLCCPRCSRPYPHFTWLEFRDAVAADHS